MRPCPNCSADINDGSPFCEKCGMRASKSTFSDSEPVTETRKLGAVVGSYRVLEQIGSGGMGRVYLAEHRRLGRKVALKMLRSEYSSNTQAVRRFFAEARAVNRIAHENIIEITDFIENEGGDNYYIMELLEGSNLGDVLERDGILPLNRSLAIAAWFFDSPKRMRALLRFPDNRIET